MTIEETMLRQAEFYNLNASMQEQSKVGDCELRYEEERNVIYARPEPGHGNLCPHNYFLV